MLNTWTKVSDSGTACEFFEMGLGCRAKQALSFQTPRRFIQVHPEATKVEVVNDVVERERQRGRMLFTKDRRRYRCRISPCQCLIEIQ
jgi:hypothetical protein